MMSAPWEKTSIDIMTGKGFDVKSLLEEVVFKSMDCFAMLAAADVVNIGRPSLALR